MTSKTALPPRAGTATPSTRKQNPNGGGFSIQSGPVGGGQRVLIYGPGGIGKSTLASLAPSPVFLDIEEGTRHLDVPRVSGISDYADLRACLRDPVLENYQTVIIDSATKAEEMSVSHTILTVPHENGRAVTSIEGYGFGKGYSHVYDTFILLLADLDGLVRAGRNVVLIAHDCVADVPNPSGENYIRYEPHLQSPKSGKASIRHRTIQWADYVFFLGYDVISEDGKGKGGGTRTIFTTERPDHIAKSRTAIDSIPFETPDDATIWTHVCGGGS